MSFYGLLTLQKINSKSASKWFGTAKQDTPEWGVFLFGGYMRGEMRTAEGGSVEAAAKPR